MSDHWHRKRVGHIIGGMILMMLDKRVRDIDELKAFLASSDVFTINYPAASGRGIRKA